MPNPYAVAIGEAIGEAMAENADHTSDRGLLISWLLISEHIGDDGERYLSTLRSPDLPVWTALGYCEHAATLHRARIEPNEDET